MVKEESNELLAYVAGFIDADGCIGIHKGGKHKSGTVRYRMRVIVGNTDEKIIDFLQNNFGGSISVRKVVGNKKKQYAWEITTLNASAFLKKIYPYLIVKKKQAELCIKFQGDGIPMRKATEEENVIREGIITKLYELNKRGIER